MKYTFINVLNSDIEISIKAKNESDATVFLSGMVRNYDHYRLKPNKVQAPEEALEYLFNQQKS